MKASCEDWRLSLVGGDTTRGPLNVAAFVQGPEHRATDESGAKLEWVVGSTQFNPLAAATLLPRPRRVTQGPWRREALELAGRCGFRLKARHAGAAGDESQRPRLLFLITGAEWLALEQSWPGTFERLASLDDLAA